MEKRKGKRKMVGQQSNERKNIRDTEKMKERRKAFEIRTDLALEVRENVLKDSKEISGVSVHEWSENMGICKITEVKVLDQDGSKKMGKPVGTYLTLEAEDIKGRKQEERDRIAEILGQEIYHLLKEQGIENGSHILVVGLGNESVTPDALGPRTLSHLIISGHLEEKERKKMFGDGCFLSALTPGVMAQTGMETAKILQGVVKETKPDAILVIDALAARSVRRLGNTIQLSDTGIHPGSGVGNHRQAIDKDTFGIPVLALGIPTVVGTAAVAQDTLGALIEVLERENVTKHIGEYLKQLDTQEQYEWIREILAFEFGSMYVTEPDIDETIRQLALLLSDGIHRAVYPRIK